MLKHEIEPYADAHIEALESIRNDIANLLGPVHPSDNVVVVNREMLKSWHEKLGDSKHGFHRFKVCMTDEVTQKDRYYARLLDIFTIARKS